MWRSASRATDIPSSRRRRKQHHQCNVHTPCAPRCPGVNMEAGNRGSERDRADVFLSRSCSGLIRPRPRERTRATLPNFHRVVHGPSPARETRRVRPTRSRRARTVGCGTSEMLDACRRGGELENRMSDVIRKPGSAVTTRTSHMVVAALRRTAILARGQRLSVRLCTGHQACAFGNSAIRGQSPHL